jgi:hypothetical protein
MDRLEKLELEIMKGTTNYLHKIAQNGQEVVSQHFVVSSGTNEHTSYTIFITNL